MDENGEDKLGRQSDKQRVIEKRTKRKANWTGPILSRDAIKEKIGGKKNAANW